MLNGPDASFAGGLQTPNLGLVVGGADLPFARHKYFFEVLNHDVARVFLCEDVEPVDQLHDIHLEADRFWVLHVFGQLLQLAE